MTTAAMRGMTVSGIIREKEKQEELELGGAIRDTEICVPAVPVLDVSDMLAHSNDSREMIWWGNVGMIVIEGTILVLAFASYFYLRTVVTSFPPENTRLPELRSATAELVVLLLSIVPMMLADRAAYRFERGRAALWLAVVLVMAGISCALRVGTFNQLDTHWTSSAYGSIAWFVVGTQAFHLLTWVVESVALLALLLFGKVKLKYYLDVRLGAVFWYFVVGGWAASYLVVFWGPRLI